MSRRTYSSAAAFAILSFGAAAVLGLVSSVLTARLYGVETVGAFAVAMAPTAVCAALSTLQEQQALGRQLATLEPRSSRVTALFAAVQLFSTTLSLVVGIVVGAISAGLLAGPIDRPDLIPAAVVLLAGYVVFENTCWNLDVIFAVFRAGQRLFWARLVNVFAYIGIAVGFGIAGDSVWGLVAAQVGSAVVGVIGRLVAIPPLMRFRVSRAELRAGLANLPQIIRFGAKLAPGWITEAVSFESGVWILTFTSKVSDVGAWSRVWYLIRRLNEPGWRIGEVLFPTLVDRLANEDRAGFDETLIDSARYVTVALLLVASAGAGASSGIMELFGPGFVPAADALAIMLVVPALYSLAQVQTMALTATDRPGTVSRVTVVRAVVILAVGIGLSIPFGMTGLAVGYAVGFGVDVVLRGAATRPLLSRPVTEIWPRRSMLATVLAYAAGFLAARAVDDALPLVGLPLALGAGVAAFVVVFAAVGGVSTTDWRRLGTIRDRVLRPAAR